MPIWHLSPTCLIRPLKAVRLSGARYLSSTYGSRTPQTEHFKVPCASAGHVVVSLHDVMKHPATSPLIINLPSFPARDIDNVGSYLPGFLHRFPTATIHYRWANPQEKHSPDVDPSEPATEAEAAEILARSTPLYWPTPLHDTLCAYDFLVKYFSPIPSSTSQSSRRRRPVYVYGSYLGGSLASSLALTESHTHEPMGIRGLLAFNGIFNWTTLLPDHPSNQLILNNPLDDHVAFENDKDLRFMKQIMPSHFHQPANLFDPFASPVLFFHTSGMLVPQSFTRPTPPDESQHYPVSSDVELDDPYEQPYVFYDPDEPPPPSPYEDMDADTDAQNKGTSAEAASPADSPALKQKPPRKGFMTFPPRTSSLKIPETLLLHTTPPPIPAVLASARGPRAQVAMWKRLKAAENSFGAQALSLGGLMRRSINLVELRDRMKWDLDYAGWETEALRRVQVQEVGDADMAGGVPGLGGVGEDIAARWLESRFV